MTQAQLLETMLRDIARAAEQAKTQDTKQTLQRLAMHWALRLENAQ